MNKNNHDIRLTEAYHHAMASDYYRRQRRKQTRLIADICVFFFLGVLFMVLAEMITSL
jgi:hypothetical protein